MARDIYGETLRLSNTRELQMAEGSRKTVRDLAEALHMAELAQAGGALHAIVDAANANGYDLTKEEVRAGFVEIFAERGKLPEWIKRKLKDSSHSAYYPD